MKALITGGAGFIGSHTADALINRGIKVKILDNLQEPVHQNKKIPDYLNKKCEFHFGDVTNESDLVECMKDCDIIFHFAAYQDYLPFFSKFVDVNISSTAKIYEIAVREKLPIKKIIVASSQATLGEGQYKDSNNIIFSPDSRTEEALKEKLWEVESSLHTKPFKNIATNEEFSNPQNPYGMSKIAEENFAIYLGKKYNIPSVAMRYSIVQGDRQSLYNTYSGACRIFSISYFSDTQPTIYEDGNQIRDFVNIQDVVKANMLVVEKEESNYNVYNVGGGKEITILDFCEAVSEVFNKRFEPNIPNVYRYGDTRHIFSDISKISELGWEPQKTIYDSIESYKAWLYNNKEDLSNNIKQQLKNMKNLGVIKNTNEN